MQTSHESLSARWRLVGSRLAAWCLGTLALTSGCDTLTGTTQATGCIAQKCCDDVWTLTCPDDAVDAVYEGDTNGVDGLACPSDVRCWLEIRSRPDMPQAAAWQPRNWNPPRVVDRSGEPLELSAPPRRIAHPGNWFRLGIRPDCPAGICHEFEIDEY